MNEELLALAYELAVSSYRTDEILNILVENHQLSSSDAVEVMMEIITLRAPDNEFIVGDKVRFIHWETGYEIIGEVTQAEWLNRRLQVHVTCADGGGYSLAGWRLTFYHGDQA